MKTEGYTYFRIAPEHVGRLRWFLARHYSRAEWQLLEPENDTHWRLEGSDRTGDLAHAFCAGLAASNVAQEVLDDV